MLRLSCPKCRKDSYSNSVESFTQCPYCGFVFSGTYGPDKRHEERVKKEIPFVFSSHEQNLQACTLDLSETGLGIQIFGKPSIAKGDVLDLSIEELRVRAKVMWVRKLPEKFLAGLGRLN